MTRKNTGAEKMQAELILDANDLLGEGPWWSTEEKCLYRLDIERHLLRRFDPESGRESTLDLGSMVGCTAPCKESPPGRTRILAAGQSGIDEIEFSFENDVLCISSRKIFAHPEADKTDNRYNDGKCSPEGRFWFGSLNMRKRPNQAALYRLERDGITCNCVLQGLTNANGLGWSPEGAKFYHIDTPTLCVKEYRYDPDSGEIADPRVCVRFPEEPGIGRPDGMTVDAEGMLWVAHWAGGRITRHDPEGGKIIATITVPASRVSSLTFGGPNLERLFITTARSGASESELEEFPLSGGVFSCEPGVRGLPVNAFG